MRNRAIFAAAVLFALAAVPAFGQSLDIPVKGFGLSFGNSKNFTGLRFNFRDKDVEKITGINVTLWSPRDKELTSVITGISLGPLVGGGSLSGIQYGLFGVAGTTRLTGLNVGGLGLGAGGDVVGVNLGGLGMGAGGSISGLSFAGIGLGSGGDITGITVAGIGAGASGKMAGVNIAGIGVGAKRLVGLTFAGIGAGAEEITGWTAAGIGVGARTIRGVAYSGGMVGAKELKGAFFAFGSVHVPLGGSLSGYAQSTFNYIRGPVRGCTIGIVNYAHSVKGIQLGLVNIVRDNPPGLRVLPVFNTSF